MKSPNIAFLLIIALLGSGCGSQETPIPSDTQAKNPSVKNAPDGKAAPGESYRIQPADPNDPNFKPDPKLAGGG